LVICIDELRKFFAEVALLEKGYGFVHGLAHFIAVYAAFPYYIVAVFFSLGRSNSLI